MKNKNKMSATQKIKVEETESSIVSRSQGRPAHGDWYGFTKIKRNDRSIAKCNNCSKLVMNTSKARLECHRYETINQFSCEYFTYFIISEKNALQIRSKFKVIRDYLLFIFRR